MFCNFACGKQKIERKFDSTKKKARIFSFPCHQLSISARQGASFDSLRKRRGTHSRIPDVHDMNGVRCVVIEIDEFETAMH